MRRKEIAVRNYNLFIAAVLCGVVLTLTACGGGGGGVTGPSGPSTQNDGPPALTKVTIYQLPPGSGAHTAPIGTLLPDNRTLRYDLRTWYEVFYDLDNIASVPLDFEITSYSLPDQKLVRLVNGAGRVAWTSSGVHRGGQVSADFMVDADLLAQSPPGGHYQVRFRILNLGVEYIVDLWPASLQ